MQTRSLRQHLFCSSAKAWINAILLVAILAWVPANASAQVRIPAEALSLEANLQQVLDQGQRLESENRWAEALSHYEEAVREYPSHSQLQDRLVRARVHYDLGRRYDDASFREAVRVLSATDALRLYEEVLTKIQVHYVQAADWQQLARSGVQNLIVALEQPAFRSSHALTASVDAVSRFCHELQRRMDVTVVRNRQDARDVANVVAQLAQDQLGLPSTATILEFTCGATCSLDQYSSFLTSAQLEDVLSQIEGNFVGLGIELKAEDQALMIVDVIAGSPAARAGIVAGNRIIAVDGVSTTSVSTDEAANMLKGPEGSMVDIRLVRSNGSQTDLRLPRQRVEVPSVEHVGIVDRDLGIGYLRISSFQKTTIRDIDAALWKLHQEGMKSLVIDVRKNPGGLLRSSVELADKFLTSGNIVSTRGRSRDEDFDYQAHTVGTWQVPLVVLIDGDTASASEIFAGAIHDHGRGTVIGQRSYGKGSVQGIFTLDSSTAGIRLTTAKFYSPSGHAISNRGVYPDLVVHNQESIQTVLKPVLGATGTETASPSDTTLQAAVQFIRNRSLSQRNGGHL